jgi:hypothetical protein
MIENKNMKNKFGLLLFTLIFFQFIIPITAKAAGANICAYVAPDGKYACVPNSNANAANINTCSRRTECTGKTCIILDSDKCGSLAKIWACVAGNGKYACSPSNNQYLTDVTADGGGCTAVDAIQIDPALCGSNAPTRNPSTPSSPAPTPATPPSSNSPTDKLYNPLPEEELTHMFLFIAKGFLGIVGIWAVIFIIVGGFRMVIASGDEEALTKAKKTVTWAVIGVIVAALSFSIVAIVQNLLNADIKSAQIQNKNSRNI